MEINSLEINNYKSIQKLTLKDVGNFSVFVGANASGKSNIFEAIEFFNECAKNKNSISHLRLFGSAEDIIHRNGIFGDKIGSNLSITMQINKNYWPILHLFTEQTTEISFKEINFSYANEDSFLNGNSISNSEIKEFESNQLTQFYNFTRLFIGNSSIKRQIINDGSKLNADASNLEAVLKRILKIEEVREDFLQELNLLIPGFENIEIRSDEVAGTDSLLIYEKGTKKPFGKKLLSDGTYNIIALLTAVYQSNEPQFLCIEEPENGLNPFVAKEFVRVFRDACTDKGHFIWINTHSQSILSALTKQEVIIVDKINGSTIAKQITELDLQGLTIDETLFTNILGGGTPW